MRDIDDMMAIVPVEEIRELKEENENYQERLQLFNEVMKNVEIFLTYWYENTTEFGKIKDDFNELDDVPCEMRVVDGNVKIKLLDNES